MNCEGSHKEHSGNETCPKYVCGLSDAHVPTSSAAAGDTTLSRRGVDHLCTNERGKIFQAYLVCSLFKDGCEVERAILHIDLGRYCTDSIPGIRPDITVEVPGYAHPAERLRAVIRLQGETASARDAYLAELLSEEATRSATLALLKEDRNINNSEEVEQYINETAAEIGLTKEWQSAQDLVRETKGKEEEILKLAIERYRKPKVELEE